MTDALPTTETKVHDKFNAPDADIVLVSSDGVSFKVHKKNLAFHSFVFREMFEVGTSQGLDEVSLTETSKVLEIVVGFCYPDCASPVPGDGQELVELARACHKYDIVRGMEAVAAKVELLALRACVLDELSTSLRTSHFAPLVDVGNGIANWLKGHSSPPPSLIELYLRNCPYQVTLAQPWADAPQTSSAFVDAVALVFTKRTAREPPQWRWLRRLDNIAFGDESDSRSWTDSLLLPLQYLALSLMYLCGAVVMVLSLVVAFPAYWVGCNLAHYSKRLWTSSPARRIRGV